MTPDAEQILAIFDREQRQEVETFGAHREVSGNVIRLISEPDQQGWSAIIYSQLDATTVGAEIEDQIGYFECLGRDFEWKIYTHDQPLDLLERLAARGFEIGDREAVMVLDLLETPDLLRRSIAHDMRRVEDPERVKEVLIVQEQVDGFDLSWLADELSRQLCLDHEGLSVFAAYWDGALASSAWIRFHRPGRFASLWGGATLPQYRRRGLYSGLLAIRAQAAWERGFRFLTVDASDMSRPILEKFGFRRITYTYPCTWRARVSQ